MATTVATPADFWRLADQAVRHGIQILEEPFSGEHFATSGTDPRRLYRVTGFSCTCAGFISWQRCQHHSLLLAELGWLPDLGPDEPEPASLAVCPPRPPRMATEPATVPQRLPTRQEQRGERTRRAA